MNKIHIILALATFLSHIGCKETEHYPKLSNEVLQQLSYCPNMSIMDPIYFPSGMYDVEKGYFFDLEKINGDLLYEVCINGKGEPFHVEQIWGQKIIGDYFKRRIFGSRLEKNSYNTAKLPARAYVGIRIRDIENEKYKFLPDKFSKYVKYQNHRYPLGTLNTAINNFVNMFQKKDFSEIATISHLPIKLNTGKSITNGKELDSLITEYIPDDPQLLFSIYLYPIKHNNNYHLTLQKKNRTLTLIFSSSCLTGGYRITGVSII